MLKAKSKLIVLRGNSGSGKSTTAKMLRDAAIAKGTKTKIAIIEQDYLRRYILKEKEEKKLKVLSFKILRPHRETNTTARVSATTRPVQPELAPIGVHVPNDGIAVNFFTWYSKRLA